MTNKHSVVIIDYGLGNLFSVQQACQKVGLKAVISSNIKELMGSKAAILPGVGAFGDAMANINRLGLAPAIKDFIASGKPFMGICLGMQLLMTESEEFGSYQGLDVFKGSVTRFSAKMIKKIPQVGWNVIYPSKQRSKRPPILKGLPAKEYMYFVHSYFVVPQDRKNVLTLTSYEGTEFCSTISRDNVFACQFHPEKSAERGLRIYNNFKDTLGALE